MRVFDRNRTFPDQNGTADRHDGRDAGQRHHDPCDLLIQSEHMNGGKNRIEAAEAQRDGGNRLEKDRIQFSIDIERSGFFAPWNGGGASSLQ